ncbi:MAG: tyrosine-type recombinase/integrase [Hydrogenovibrio sp.]
MALTDAQIRKAKPTGKLQKLSDGSGLRLEVTKAGTKVFKYRIRMDGKDSDYKIGEYPNMTLAEARNVRDEIKALVQQGIHPNDHKKQQQAEQEQEAARQQAKAARLSFRQLFEEWHRHNSESKGGDNWKINYAKDIRERVEAHLIPLLGNLPAEDIKPQHMIRALKEIEAKGRLETLKRSRQYASRIFSYGVGMGYCERNPVRDLPNDIFQKQKKTNYSHVSERKDLHQLLNAIDGYLGDISTATALKLAPYVFLRPKELAGLRWDEVNLTDDLKLGTATLKHGAITIKADRMKMGREHIVPLSQQTRALIESMLVFSDGTDFVFPSPRTKARPISEQSLNAGLHRIGFKGKQTAHGFRHTASTLLNEQGFNRDHIEKQLAHEGGKDAVRETYNKAEYLSQRADMMQAWADHLDSLKAGADVVPLFAKNRPV